MINQGSALVLPEGTVPKIELSGDVLEIQVLSYSPENDWTCVVQYPDGFTRHHRIFDLIGLLDKVAGQLKTRYNLKDFHFKAIPPKLESGEIITIGGITYA